MGEASSAKTFADRLATEARLMGVSLSYQRVEDKLTPGVPDANVCLGSREWWQENKHIKEFPSRASTVVRFDEALKPEQVNWLENRQLAGGRAFIVCRVARVGWYVFDSNLRALKEATRADWEQFTCFLTTESLAKHMIERIDNDQYFGRPLFRGRHHQTT